MLSIFSQLKLICNHSFNPLLKQSYFWRNYYFCIYLASGSRAAKALDVTAKVIGSAAGSTFLYNYWVKGSSSSSNSGNNDENKKDKKEGNKTTSNQGTNGK